MKVKLYIYYLIKFEIPMKTLAILQDRIRVRTKEGDITVVAKYEDEGGIYFLNENLEKQYVHKGNRLPWVTYSKEELLREAWESVVEGSLSYEDYQILKGYFDGRENGFGRFLQKADESVWGGLLEFGYLQTKGEETRYTYLIFAAWELFVSERNVQDFVNEIQNYYTENFSY